MNFYGRLIFMLAATLLNLNFFSHSASAATLVKPISLVYSEQNPVYTKGRLIENNIPSSTGGAIASYSVTPNLPAGLVLNTRTGIISGTPRGTSATAYYTVVATNAAGIDRARVYITVVEEAPKNLIYSQPRAEYIEGKSITVNVPTASGGPVESYSVSPALPSGLTLNTRTGVISGVPKVADVNTKFRVVATNSGGSDAVLVYIQVLPLVVDTPLNRTQQLDIVDGATGISILNDYPNIPANFRIVNYENMARSYDKIAFKRIPNAQPEMDFFFFSGNEERHLPDSIFNFETFQMSPYVLKFHKSVGEAVGGFPSVVSSSLMDIDMTNTTVAGESTPRNLVRMTKRNFQTRFGLFGNAPDNVGTMGNSFWYDLLPNIYAMQLSSLYSKAQLERGAASQELTYDDLVHKSANTLYMMSSYLRTVPGGNSSMANFNYSGVKVLDPDKGEFEAQFRYDGNGAVPEPDSAAGVALMGVMAFEKWKEPKHLEMSKWALNFLDQYPYNPYYEVLLPYGALAAARMMSQFPEKNYNFDLKKHLKNCFSEGSIRIDHGVLSSSPKMPVSGGLWGGYPVDGLWGPRGYHSNYYGGMAHYKNSILQAVTLAPIARYNTSYAKALGKYLLNVASNAKVFFSANLPQTNPEMHQDTTTLNFLNTMDPAYKLAIPYESVRHVNWSLNGQMFGGSPFASGDAVDYGWAGTDLSIYSGSETGYIAAILKRTSDPYIPQWDLLKTDFNHPKAFPSYLLFNPFSEMRTVTINLREIRKDYPTVGTALKLYDAISDKVLATDLAGDSVKILIPAQSTVVLVAVPNASNLQKDSYERLVDSKTGTVVDYHTPSPEQFNEKGNPIR